MPSSGWKLAETQQGKMCDWIGYACGVGGCRMAPKYVRPSQSPMNYIGALISILIWIILMILLYRTEPPEQREFKERRKKGYRPKKLYKLKA